MHELSIHYFINKNPRLFKPQWGPCMNCLAEHCRYTEENIAGKHIYTSDSSAEVITWDKLMFKLHFFHRDTLLLESKWKFHSKLSALSCREDL